ncbi:diguanylate cyclase [Labrys okinawensis]|uniref:sensor domain-containing diguanylate cyclase n=1 Tax=Labrys okinawensis TaxID=346911 RepID=UPI0039BC6CA8
MKLFDERRLAALRAYETIEMGRDHGLDALCNLVRLTFAVPMSAVSLVDDENTYHMGLAGMEMEVVPAQLSFCSHTIETDSPLLVEDASKDARFASNPFVTADPGIRSYMGAPLIASDGSALGAICAVDTKARHFSNDESEKLASLAKTAMQILEMRRRVKEVRDLALTDGLTGIPNRTKLELEIEKALAVLQRHGLPFSLLYIDVDGFKQVNDVRGHAAGDELLRLIGRTLADRTRREETCGRLGGDEFAILMIGGNEEEGHDAAARVKERLDSVVAQADFPVSFSMGLAVFNTPPNGVEAALGVADQLLYDAKRKGKNQIVVR